MSEAIAKSPYHFKPPAPPKGNQRAKGAKGNRKPRGRFKDPVFINRLALCLRAGMSEKETADCLGVSERTLARYKAKPPEDLSGFPDWKAAADELVERSMFKRAVGYEAPDTHFSSYEGKVTATPTKKHIPPDPSAGMFWLKSRKRDEWGDREPGERRLVNININFGQAAPPVNIPAIEVKSEVAGIENGIARQQQIENTRGNESQPSEPAAEGQQDAGTQAEEKKNAFSGPDGGTGGGMPPFTAPPNT